MPSQTVIILGGYNVALSLIRSLQEKGYHLVVLATDRWDYAQHSRFVNEWHRVESEGLVDWLLTNSSRWPGAVLIPSGDAILELLLGRREEVRQTYKVSLPEPETYALFQNKAQSHDLAARLAVAQPESHLVSSRSELTSLSTRLKFPVLLKPVCSHRFFAKFRCKLWVIQDPEQLEHDWSRAQKAGLPCMMTEWIRGSDDNLYFYVSHRHQGQVWSDMLVQKLRQHPPRFGVGRVTKTVPMIDEVRSAAQRLLSHCDYEGFSSVEFKRDPNSGEFKFIEVNLRPILQETLLTRAGINFSDHMVQELMGQSQPAPSNYTSGVYWHYAAADLVNCLRYPTSLSSLDRKELLRPYLARQSVALIPFFEDPRLFLIKTFGSLLKIASRYLA